MANEREQFSQLCNLMRGFATGKDILKLKNVCWLAKEVAAADVECRTMEDHLAQEGPD